MSSTMSKRLLHRPILILGKIQKSVALNLGSNEAGGGVDCSFLRAMSEQQYMCEREHCRDAVTKLLGIWGIIFLSPQVFSKHVRTQGR